MVERRNKFRPTIVRYVNGQIVAVDGGVESTGIGLATLRAGDG